LIIISESEADYIGLLLMAQACYDPREAIPFWKRMEQVHRGQGAQFFSTHPSPAHRIEKLQEWMPEATKKYESSECVSQLSEVVGQFKKHWAHW
jgi:predicted Zn-dependent protease